MKLIILITFLIVSCRTFQTGSGGGDGGSVPTASDLDDYIKKMTTPENRKCGNIETDEGTNSKYPIIYPSGKYQWKSEYSEAISQQFDKDYMAPLREQKIDEGDLSLLDCTGYNYATSEEKKKFWELFLASLSKPESNFNPNEEYREKNGTVSTGLLQIDPKASNRWCGILKKENNKDEYDSGDMKDPKTNLQCGMLMMQWQIMGVPLPVKLNRPELKGRLFTSSNAWYWSNLEMGKNGELIREFKVHAQKQLPFCKRTNPIDEKKSNEVINSRKVNCGGISRKDEKKKCEQYLINEKLQPDETDPRLGQQGIIVECKDHVDDTGRSLNKIPNNLSEKNKVLEPLDAAKDK